jgi:peptidoglycan-N-acetylglucosamine deacetylase
MIPRTQPPTNKGLVIALIGVVIVAALIIWGLKSSKQPVPIVPTANEKPAEQWPSRAVKKQTITDNSKTAEISAEYPQTGRADITDKLRGFVENQIATFKTDTAGMPEEFRAVTLDITYDEDQNNRADNYVFHMYSDTGGAHGIQATQTFSFDIAGNEITLDNLFINKTKGLQLVADFVKQELLKRQGADSKWISDGAAPEEENYQNFTVDETSVTFMFDPYQVASYASGPQTVIVPINAFKSQANPQFFK